MIKGGRVVPDFKQITVGYKTEDFESWGLHQTIYGYIQANGSVIATIGKYFSSDISVYPHWSDRHWESCLHSALE